MDYRTLNQGEYALLARLLAVEHPAYTNLLRQLDTVLVRELDSEGTLLFGRTVHGEVMEHKVEKSLPYLGIAEDEDGTLIQFAVFIDGSRRLAALEVTKLDGSPIKTTIEPKEVKLKEDKPGTSL